MPGFANEELVANPAPILQKIGAVLDRPLRAIHCWAPEAVHAPMLKLARPAEERRAIERSSWHLE